MMMETPLPQIEQQRDLLNTDPPKAVKVIPAFTGENELWTMWLGRFKAISSQWTDNEKLSAMLPLLRGTAGTYVFDILPAHIRGNYDLLIKELTARFKKIITTTHYKKEYSKIKQRPTQSLENLAIVIRETYEKAWPDREPHIKQEDLLWKFIDSLYDPHTRLALEYYKEPESIDEALEKAIAYEDATREMATKTPLSQIEATKMSLEDVQDAEPANENNKGNNMSYVKSGVKGTGTSEALKKLDAKLNKLLEQGGERPRQQRLRIRRNRQTGLMPNRNLPTPTCWNCSTVGHFSRSCPYERQQCHTCQKFGHLAQYCWNSVGQPKQDGAMKLPQLPWLMGSDDQKRKTIGTTDHT